MFACERRRFPNKKVAYAEDTIFDMIGPAFLLKNLG